MIIMSYPSPYVLDTSALINLIDSGYSEKILEALKVPCLLEGFVLNELTKHTSRATEIMSLCRKGLLSLVDMTEEESNFFITLIMPPPQDSLHDGEAATLSVSKFRNGIAVIDEKKATRIATEKNPPIRTCCTIDLFNLPSVKNALGSKRLNDAFFNALMIARMRIPSAKEKWVFDLLTNEQIMQCPSVRKKVKQDMMNSVTNYIIGEPSI